MWMARAPVGRDRASSSTMTSWVSGSWRPISGWRWIRRRIATTSGWIARAAPRRSSMPGSRSVACSVVVIGRGYDSPSRRASDAEPLQHRAAPGLGRLDGVERVEVEARDARRRIGDERREVLDESGRLVEAAAPGEAGHETEVLHEEALRVLDADPGRDREELLGIGDAGDADDDLAIEALGP